MNDAREQNLHYCSKPEKCPIQDKYKYDESDLPSLCPDQVEEGLNLVN